jgi:hypothetical protein
MWYHFDFTLRLCIEPFEELMVNGNPLKLWNSLVPRMCFLVAAERQKIARVDAAFLNRLLYWRENFPDILPFFALYCKRLFQDVRIEFQNRTTSQMSCRDNVSAAGRTSKHVVLSSETSIESKLGERNE